MNALESAFVSQLRTRVRDSVGTAGFSVALKNYLTSLSKLLISPSFDTVMGTALEIGYLLKEYPDSSELWGWIHRQATNAKPETREAFRIAFLELIPKRPTDIVLTNKLWENSTSPETRWMLLAAYQKNPDALDRDHRAVNSFRQRQGLNELPMPT